MNEFRKQRTLKGYLKEKTYRMWAVATFFFSGFPTLAIATFLFTPKRRWMKWALFFSSVPLIASLFTPWMHPHYLAPLAGLIFLGIAEGTRRIAKFIQFAFRSSGNSLFGGEMRFVSSPYFACLLVVCVAERGIAEMAEAVVKQDQHSWHLKRAEIATRLKLSEGEHLVIVESDSPSEEFQTWVSNEACIDQAKIVWAHSIGNNTELLEYFSRRQVWTLDPNAPRLRKVCPSQKEGR
ncbi:MAG: hypothetical protein AB8B50_04080 [Pirellulaceae bacterium]